MASIKKSGTGVALELNQPEKETLLNIVDELSPQLEQNQWTCFRAYDDPNLEKEYQQWTMPAIIRSREDDLSVIRDSLLQPATPVELNESHTWAWTRGLNHLRLIAGSHLQIENNDWEAELSKDEQNNSYYRMLSALGWIQEALINALDS